ncbi:hypothetical protein [Halorientalis salina]|uniref:hypothetical protein n=1 Tax=Halorientalis salina TaxID=2932266 RepID=UPI0010AC0E14|nr:hypothetical protein [Halorientalis salina]
MDTDRGWRYVAIGLVLVLGAWWGLGQVQVNDVTYVHTVTETHEQFDASEPGHLRYENLSDRGKQVFDRALDEEEYAVDTEEDTAPEFQYVTDNSEPGSGRYVVQYQGDNYSVRTSERTDWVLGSMLRLGITVAGLLGALFLVSGVVTLYRAD